MKHWPLTTIALLLFTVTSLAQSNTCPAVIQTAMDQVIRACDATGRNEACYGNNSVSSVPAESQSVVFNAVGDHEPLNKFNEIITAPLNVELGEWGIAMVRLQANLPDTMPGQNATIILFGDAALTPSLEQPSRAFILRTGITDSPCAEAPDSGILVQTPHGDQRVEFTVNGVDLSVGSTVLFRTQRDKAMQVIVIEGSAIANIGGMGHPALAGSFFVVPFDAEGVPQTPTLTFAYSPYQVRDLPIVLLPRPIEVAPPLSPAELNALQHRVARNQPPCGDEAGLLPGCDTLMLTADQLTALFTGSYVVRPYNGGASAQANNNNNNNNNGQNNGGNGGSAVGNNGNNGGSAVGTGGGAPACKLDKHGHCKKEKKGKKGKKDKKDDDDDDDDD